MNVMITGISSGIGYETAKLLAGMGHNVVGTVRRFPIRRLPGVKYVLMDMDDSQSVSDGWNTCGAFFAHQLDVLFLNAGFGLPGAVEDLTGEALRHQFQCNFFSQQQLIRSYLAMNGHDRVGRIIVNSSVLGFFPAPYRGAYCASKFALEGMLGALRAELQKTNSKVLVHSLQPGPIKTRFRQRSLKEFEDHIQPSTRYASDYEKMRGRLASRHWDRTALEAKQAALKVEKMIAATNNTVYRMNIGTQIAWFLRRILSTTLITRIAAKGNP
ncbi:MAG: short-chain dehydrogenase [Oleiphilus sp.]|nr:MAG: short-chain dehydrogenase [Oleiphilus sp.]